MIKPPLTRYEFYKGIVIKQIYEMRTLQTFKWITIQKIKVNPNTKRQQQKTSVQMI